MRSCRYPRSAFRAEWARGLRYRGRCLLLPCATTGGSLDIAAAACVAEPLAPVHDDFAAREHGPRVPGYLIAFEHRVVHTHVMRGGADGMDGIGVPQNDIGVAARGDRTFLRIHAEDTCGGSGGGLDETIQCHLARVHAVVEYELKTVLNPWAAVGNLGEVPLAQDFLVFEAEGAVIRGNHLEMIVFQAVPELRQVMLRP